MLRNKINLYRYLPVLVIPYFFFSSGLYHIAYWSTFDINGLAYLGISEIIKSFIYPFIAFGFTFFISVLVMEIVFRGRVWFNDGSQEVLFPDGGGANTKLGRFLNSTIGIQISMLSWLLMLFLITLGEQPTKWIIWATFASLAPFFILARTGFLSDYFTNENHRLFIIRLLLYVPLFSFASGKYESELIYKNRRYRYIITDTNTPISSSYIRDTMKFVGQTERYLFLSGLDNSNIFLISNDKVNSLTFLEFHDSK